MPEKTELTLAARRRSGDAEEEGYYQYLALATSEARTYYNDHGA